MLLLLFSYTTCVALTRKVKRSGSVAGMGCPNASRTRSFVCPISGGGHKKQSERYNKEDHEKRRRQEMHHTMTSEAKRALSRVSRAVVECSNMAPKIHRGLLRETPMGKRAGAVLSGGSASRMCGSDPRVSRKQLAGHAGPIRE